MCPGSPAKPWAPRCGRPPVTIPAPMPVPSVTRTASVVPFAAPNWNSHHVAQFASLSTATAQLRRSINRASTGNSITPGKFGANRKTPSRSTNPGTPTPTASRPPPATTRSSAPSTVTTSTKASSIASAPRGVSIRCSAKARRSSAGSSTRPRILVPPTSTPATSPWVTNGYRCPQYRSRAPIRPMTSRSALSLQISTLQDWPRATSTASSTMSSTRSIWDPSTGHVGPFGHR